MATIKDIAQKAHVSAATVSRILNQDESLSVTDQTRNRVLKIAEELNYIKKKPVKNKEIWQEIYNLTKIHKVKFIKVKGHADNEFNNRCDELARNAIKTL